MCIGTKSILKDLKDGKVEIKEHKPEAKELKDAKNESKDTKDHKSEAKDLKDHKWETKEKFEIKEHKAEKAEVDVGPKPIIDNPKISDGPGPIINPINPVGQGLDARVTQLEATVGQLATFITGAMRPDLSAGALKQEPDLNALSHQLQQQAAQAAQAKADTDCGCGH
jgi:hypothetical protein